MRIPLQTIVKQWQPEIDIITSESQVRKRLQSMCA
jgi:hypothetical protein